MANGTHIIYVAPSNSTQKDIADYVCNGTNDSQQINAAITAAKTGAEIILLDGKFNITEKIIVNKGDLVIRGIGHNKTVVEQVELNGSTSAIIFDISADNVRIEDMMLVDVDVDYPQFIIRSSDTSNECIYERIFFILKSTKTNINAYVDLGGLANKIINCRVYNYRNIPEKDTINIVGSKSTVVGMLNTGNGPVRINFSNTSYNLFGNDNTEIYVNGVKQ